MTGLLIAVVIALLVPLFVGTWRTSLLGLAAQGALMAAMALRIHHGQPSPALALEMFDLALLRMIGMPLAVYVVLRAQSAPGRNDVIAPNLFSWALALALVVVAFRTADVLVPTEGDDQLLVAVASAGVLLGLFVLSTARGVISQIIGLVRVENAIALFELGHGKDHESLAIRLGQTAVFLVSIGFYRWYLVGLARDDSPASSTKSPETIAL
jgi:hydrogenase-4 component E